MFRAHQLSAVELHPKILAALFVAVACVLAPAPRVCAAPARWDTFSDTWVATDALGRSLPSYTEVGPPRPDRTVALFYFLWHGAHVQGGPYDITKILQQDPGAISNKISSWWGPLHAPHHWGESVFGYYLTDDAGVLRKHAQMLGDAGVDAIIFDVSNQVTYRPYYEALLKVFAEVRGLGANPPRVAFLCPFAEPAKVVAELYRDLYEPGRYSEQWFRWEGKPLILADPRKLGHVTTFRDQNNPARLQPGHRLGQTFKIDAPLLAVAGCFPTWAKSGSGLTLSLYRDGPTGPRLRSRRFENVADNGWLGFNEEPPLPPGVYYLEMSEGRGTVGWWSHTDDRFPAGQAYADAAPVAGDRNLQLTTVEPQFTAIRRFFTFRRPQPDYFQGQTIPNEWSWLEVYPQHLFTNAAGEREQMSVGVSQNAVGHRLGSMSEPGARGRSFHQLPGPTPADAVSRGLNVAEQWARARREDPRLIFITGWNEWIAGRFDEFNGVRQPVMFVDQFDQEHSRDIEPMQGGHGDNYYYQMISEIRRYKGVRAPPPARPQSIVIDGHFEDWGAVEPEFRDDRGDPVQRDHAGWGAAGRYVNHTGRNDIIAAKVSWDRNQVYFYVRTREPLTPSTDPNWMFLFLDTDHNPTNGWLGYDFVVGRRASAAHTVSLEKQQGAGYSWQLVANVDRRSGTNELELAIPRSVLGLPARSAALAFKWADHLAQTGHWSDFTLHGDTAPNQRCNYLIQIRD